MTVLYVAMIAAGVAAICWGLAASHRLPGIKGTLAALLVLVGVIVTLLGVLLFVVPGFFQG